MKDRWSALRLQNREEHPVGTQYAGRHPFQGVTAKGGTGRQAKMPPNWGTGPRCSASGGRATYRIESRDGAYTENEGWTRRGALGPKEESFKIVPVGRPRARVPSFALLFRPEGQSVSHVAPLYFLCSLALACIMRCTWDVLADAIAATAGY